MGVATAAQRKTNGRASAAKRNGRAPAPAIPPYQLIPLAQIQPSATNPRKHFDETALAELAASIQAKGVLHPILVRPTGVCRNGTLVPESYRQKHPDTPGQLFQLVAGERRYRAAQLAGLAEIPTVVRELSDKEAEEIQSIENDQRADLTPLERADGYHRLIERHGYTAETLAAAVHRSKAFVYGMLKLASLPAAARDAVAAGTLPAC